MTAPVVLFTRSWEGPDPSRPPVVILHGLLGSSRNWFSAAPLLATGGPVFAVDLRNHGESPHTDLHDYAAMMADLEALRQRMGWDAFHLIGHSMGGKVAMRYACTYPEYVQSLTVVDIAAADHQPYHAREVEALVQLDLPSLKDRRQADERLAETITDWAMRQFLLTNLKREGQGWAWIVNLPVIRDALPGLARNSLVPEDAYDGPMLLLLGERSSFVRPVEARAMRTFFPRQKTVIIPRAGHNIHFEEKEAFADAWTAFRDAP